VDGIVLNLLKRLLIDTLVGFAPGVEPVLHEALKLPVAHDALERLDLYLAIRI